MEVRSEFFAWLGETLTAHYGRFFQEHGFDSLEVLAQLTDDQVNHMLAHYIPISKVGHRFHFENRLAILRRDGSNLRSDSRLHINWAAGGGASAPAPNTSAHSRRPRAAPAAIGAPPPQQLSRAPPAPTGHVLHDPMSNDFKAPDDDHPISGRSSSAIEPNDASAPHDVMHARARAKPAAATPARRPLSSLRKPPSPSGLIKSPIVKQALPAQTPEKQVKPTGTRYPFISPPSPQQQQHNAGTNAGREASAGDDGAYDKLLAMLHAAPALNAAKRLAVEDVSGRTSPSRLYF